MTDKSRLSGSSPIFQDAGFAAEIGRILETHFVSRHIRAGQLLWREGDTNGMLVSLVEGRVKIYRLLPQGKAVTNFIFGPGDVFGFMPLFDDSPYPAYAQAIVDVHARIVTRSMLHEAIRQDPELALLLLKQLSRRLRDAFDHIDVLSVHGVVRKVAMALLSLLTDDSGRGGLKIVTLPVSSMEFASLYGLTPESFSRGITQLVEAGAIHRLSVNSFQVLNLDELTRQAHSGNL